jgi:DNA polymerase III sliding clamp (beta) subunit (PCNA family)
MTPFKITDFSADLIGVKHEEFLKLLNKMTVEEVDMKIDNEILISWKRSESGLRYESIDLDFLMQEVYELAKTDPQKDWASLPSDFISGLKLVKGCAAKDIYSEVLNCIYFNQKDKSIIACDNFRMSKFKFDDMIDAEFLLPYSAANVLSTIPVTKYKQFKDSNWIYFTDENKGVIIGCRTDQGEYPNLNEYFKADEHTEITFSKEMVDVINRAEVFSSDTGEVKTVDVTLTKNKIEIYAQKDEGWVREKERVKYSGKEFTFTINIDSLREILNYTNTGEIRESTIRFEHEKFVYVNAIG